MTSRLLLFSALFACSIFANTPTFAKPASTPIKIELGIGKCYFFAKSTDVNAEFLALLKDSSYVEIDREHTLTTQIDSGAWHNSHDKSLRLTSKEDIVDIKVGNLEYRDCPLAYRNCVRQQDKWFKETAEKLQAILSKTKQESFSYEEISRIAMVDVPEDDLRYPAVQYACPFDIKDAFTNPDLALHNECNKPPIQREALAAFLTKLQKLQDAPERFETNTYTVNEYKNFTFLVKTAGAWHQYESLEAAVKNIDEAVASSRVPADIYREISADVFFRETGELQPFIYHAEMNGQIPHEPPSVRQEIMKQCAISPHAP